ncbi:hypothetical protein LTR12_016493 [Friedmanniomyces endolithicus]|nr:hypothetical protein LTR12_016493 [Friedmanniomyces endolithicus]
MACSTALTLTICFTLSLAVIKFLFEPFFLSPPAKLPNAQWSVPVSRLWILNKRHLRKDTLTVHSAHQRFGPLVRIGPAEISVNCIEGGVHTIYTGGLEKDGWYSNVFVNFGIRPMFGMRDYSSHSKRKRALSLVHTKSTLQSSPSLLASTRILLQDRFIPHLRRLASAGEPVEMHDMFHAIAIDFISAYVFGLRHCSDSFRQPDMGRELFHGYRLLKEYQFWPQ